MSVAPFWCLKILCVILLALSLHSCVLIFLYVLSEDWVLLRDPYVNDSLLVYTLTYTNFCRFIFPLH